MTDDAATNDTIVATKLAELLKAIRACGEPRRAPEWKHVLKLLQKADIPAVRATNIVAARDAARLAEVVEQLATPAAAAPAPANAPDLDTCRRAFHAFRKRLALTRLDDESRLGHSPLSKGEGSSILAIMPPVEWPQAVWDELVRQGRLLHVGGGLYALPKQQPPEFQG